MKEELDLSYSGIVSRIDKDKVKGREFLIELSQHLFQAKENVELIELELRKQKGLVSAYETGINHVLKHIELKKPLAINLTDRFICITENGVTMERNVI